MIKAKKYSIYTTPFRGKVVDSFDRTKSSGKQNVRITSSAYQVSAVQSKLILPPNPSRKTLLIQNLSGDTIYVNFGSPASAVPIKGFAIFTNGNVGYALGETPEDSLHILGTAAVNALQDVTIFEGI